jgi:hypothetical protein
MALLQLFTNNAVSLLQANISASDTTIIVQPGLGAEFPQPVNPGEFFLITLENIAAPLQREIIKVMGRSGDVLTGCIRAQEGTFAQSWPATNTLVDHRITAETIKQAFLQPVAPPPSSGTGGYVYAPVTILPLQSDSVSTVVYSDYRRGNKFWVTMVAPTIDLAQTFEVLTLVNGSIAGNAETVTWTRSNRLGYNFLGSLGVTLNTSTKELTVSWTNNEPNVSVTVTIVRI